MDDRPSDEAARNRWLAIQAARIGGVVLVVVGLLLAAGRIAGPVWLGYGLLAIGLADVFLVPTMLARKWRTPPR